MCGAGYVSARFVMPPCMPGCGAPDCLLRSFLLPVQGVTLAAKASRRFLAAVWKHGHAWRSTGLQSSNRLRRSCSPRPSCDRQGLTLLIQALPYSAIMAVAGAWYHYM